VPSAASLASASSSPTSPPPPPASPRESELLRSLPCEKEQDEDNGEEGKAPGWVVAVEKESVVEESKRVGQEGGGGVGCCAEEGLGYCGEGTRDVACFGRAAAELTSLVKGSDRNREAARGAIPALVGVVQPLTNEVLLLLSQARGKESAAVAAARAPLLVTPPATTAAAAAPAVETTAAVASLFPDKGNAGEKEEEPCIVPAAAAAAAGSCGEALVAAARALEALSFGNGPNRSAIAHAGGVLTLGTAFAQLSETRLNTPHAAHAAAASFAMAQTLCNVGMSPDSHEAFRSLGPTFLGSLKTAVMPAQEKQLRAGTEVVQTTTGLSDPHAAYPRPHRNKPHPGLARLEEMWLS